MLEVVRVCITFGLVVVLVVGGACITFSQIVTIVLGRVCWLRIASSADITTSLQTGRSEVLRGLRDLLNRDRPEHYSINSLKERGVEKGNVLNQTNIGTV